MFSFLALVFRFVFGKQDERDRPARVAYEVRMPLPVVSLLIPSLTRARRSLRLSLMQAYRLSRES
jgi:hypothetical protein